MLFIPGIVISAITFPGVIIHEWGHKLFCHLAKVPVYETCYFRFGNPAGYVIHGATSNYGSIFLINVAPLIINTATAIIIFLVAECFSNTLWVFLPLFWLGISIGMHSFPSSEDANNLWDASKAAVRHNPLAAFGFPTVLLIKIANVLSRIWFDLLYALALLALASSVYANSSFLAAFSNTAVIRTEFENCLVDIVKSEMQESESDYSAVQEHLNASLRQLEELEQEYDALIPYMHFSERFPGLWSPFFLDALRRKQPDLLEKLGSKYSERTPAIEQRIQQIPKDIESIKTDILQTRSKATSLAGHIHELSSILSLMDTYSQGWKVATAQKAIYVVSGYGLGWHLGEYCLGQWYYYRDAGKAQPIDTYANALMQRIARED